MFGTTLFNSAHIAARATGEINNQLSEVYDWLALDKLSLNIKKEIKFVSRINDIIIVRALNIPLIFFLENMTWTPHSDIIVNIHDKSFGHIWKNEKILALQFIMRTLLQRGSIACYIWYTNLGFE